MPGTSGAGPSRKGWSALCWKHLRNQERCAAGPFGRHKNCLRQVSADRSPLTRLDPLDLPWWRGRVAVHHPRLCPWCPFLSLLLQYAGRQRQRAGRRNRVRTREILPRRGLEPVIKLASSHMLNVWRAQHAFVSRVAVGLEGHNRAFGRGVVESSANR